MGLANGKSFLVFAFVGFLSKAQVRASSVTIPIVDGWTNGVVTIGVGTPSTDYNLLPDTGSSNTWVGAGKAYVATASSVNTNESVAVSYGSGSFVGTEYLDIVVLGGAAFNQSIGVAQYSTEIGDDLDGILGLGPEDLTNGTLFPESYAEIPTVWQNLFHEGFADSENITIDYDTVTFGQTPNSGIEYAPITTTSPASLFWGIDASFYYGSLELVSQQAGVIDHGTTLITLPTDGYTAFMNATGATQDASTGLPVLPSCDNLLSLNFTFSGHDLVISVEQYRWPASKNVAIGGEAGKCYLALQDSGSTTDEVGWILGYNTLKHLTTVLDPQNSRVGLGPGKSPLQDDLGNFAETDGESTPLRFRPPPVVRK